MLDDLAAHMGAWQLALPGQAAAMRRAASAFIEFAARPPADAEQRRICCPPVAPEERAAAGVLSTLELNEGSSCLTDTMCAGSISTFPKSKLRLRLSMRPVGSVLASTNVSFE